MKKITTDTLVSDFHRDGFCLIEQAFPSATLERWSRCFEPLLSAHIAREGERLIRGPARHYVTLPFESVFADPTVFENDDILDIIFRLVGEDAVLCQLATDTPLLGSDYQETHRDAKPLFPEEGIETPSFQLAVNFPLIDVSEENGPMEIARGTHRLPKHEALRKLETGEVRLEPIFMKRGDVLIRDVRGLHRGTPNRTNVPRPMVVLGYSRAWLFRPEVSIEVPAATLEKLSARARKLLRFNPVVDSITVTSRKEAYADFAY